MGDQAEPPAQPRFLAPRRSGSSESLLEKWAQRVRNGPILLPSPHADSLLVKGPSRRLSLPNRRSASLSNLGYANASSSATSPSAVSRPPSRSCQLDLFEKPHTFSLVLRPGQLIQRAFDACLAAGPPLSGSSDDSTVHVLLLPGIHRGPLRIDVGDSNSARILLWGERKASLVSDSFSNEPTLTVSAGSRASFCMNGVNVHRTGQAVQRQDKAGATPALLVQAGCESDVRIADCTVTGSQVCVGISGPNRWRPGPGGGGAEFGSVAISRCRLNGARRVGLVVSGGVNHVDLESTTIEHCGVGALCDSRGGRMLLDASCTVMDCFGCGIYVTKECDLSGGGCSLRGAKIEHNSGGGLVMELRGSRTMMKGTSVRIAAGG